MFRFSLQKALEVRARVERMKMKGLAEKLAIQQELETAIKEIRTKTAGQDGLLNAHKKQGRIDLIEWRMLQQFKDKMQVDLSGLNNKLSHAAQAVEEKRLELVEASRQRKTLEILREKEERRYQKKMTHFELLQADEAAGNYFLLNKAKGMHA